MTQHEASDQTSKVPTVSGVPGDEVEKVAALAENSVQPQAVPPNQSHREMPASIQHQEETDSSKVDEAIKSVLEADHTTNDASLEPPKNEIQNQNSPPISDPVPEMSEPSPKKIKLDIEADPLKTTSDDPVQAPEQENQNNGLSLAVGQLSKPEPVQPSPVIPKQEPEIDLQSTKPSQAPSLVPRYIGTDVPIPISVPNTEHTHETFKSEESLDRYNNAPAATTILPPVTSTSPSANSTLPPSPSRASPHFNGKYKFTEPSRTIPMYKPNVKPAPKKNRLVILYDKPKYYHMIMQLSELRSNPNEIVTIVELFETGKIIHDSVISKIPFDYVNLCIEYNNEFEPNLVKYIKFIKENHQKFQSFSNISYHIHFAPDRKWKTDYSEAEKSAYYDFLSTLNEFVGDKIVQCSIINKYDMDTVYITERSELTALGKEIQKDIEYWNNLKVLDYGESSIRFLPGVKFPDSLEILNIGGGYALETLTGFKMPPRLKTLLASQGAIQSIDNITFSPTLERLELADNKIYFLNQVEFPVGLEHLDLSQNRIESLRGVNFPRRLKSLNLGFNPIESIKGVKFPDNLQYLDISNIPNESMTGVKFPDSLIVLNLQASMTNTRGLKLPNTLSKVILCDNGVNSINPLKLPNSIEVLYLNNNNIKTLNKVQFPSCLKELYLGDNLITTLKNVNFPPSLEVLDIEMDPDYDEHEKHINTLKDVVFPPNLKVLKLGYHSIKVIESLEFPFSLVTLSLAYNELKTIRNVRLGNNLKTLDLSGNSELTNIDQFIIPESVSELRIPPELVPFLPGYIIARANKKQLILKKSRE